MPFYPFANLFTRIGLDALATDATTTEALETPALDAAQPALGGGTAATSAIITLVEPDPDIETGSMQLGLGDKLDMRIFTDALFAGDPSPDTPEQGFLGNCPLAPSCAPWRMYPNSAGG